MLDYLKQFLYIRFKMPIVEEYEYYQEILLILAFLDYFGLENPLGIFSLDIYPDFIEVFHNWHQKMNLKNYNFPCC
ncbi:MAG: hypothetical protein ABIL76_09395 [candidate division WOR-3 bacterium]